MTAEKRADIIEHAQPATPTADEKPQWLRDRLEWFQDLKFGLMMHWGPYCQWNCIESWPLVEEDTWARPDDLKAWSDCGRDLELFRRRYWELNKTFNPTAFDPEVWADAAKAAGMKYVNFTSKHHDGFCMFDTQTTDYKITAPDCPFHTNPRANIVKTVFDTFRRRDFAISCYFSKSDWSSPHYWHPQWPAHDRHPNYDTLKHPEIWEKFVQFVHAQVRELMSDYGHIDMLWLDGGQVRPPLQDIRMAEMAAMARKLQPGLIIADRTVGGDYEDIITPEQKIPDKPLPQTWESCLTMGKGWAYDQNDTYKSTAELIHMLIEIVAKGGNFLLNIGPAPSGRLAPEALQRLHEIGDWMSVNKEAIHGTRAVEPYAHENLRFTRKNDTVYCFVLPHKGTDIPAETVRIPWFTPANGDNHVSLLGQTAELNWERDMEGGIVVHIDNESLSCRHAWCIKIEHPCD